MITKTFYCIKCEAEVEAEEQTYSIYGTTQEGKGFFCPMCGGELGNTPDADAVYERIRDDEMFNEEEK